MKHIHSASQIFAAIMFVDDCGTKNPNQNSLSLWQRQNWKPVKILGREINSAAQHKQKSFRHCVYKKLRKSYICWVTCSSQSTTAWACLSSFSLANSLSTIRFSEVCKTTAAKPSLHVSIASSVLDRRSWYNLPIMRQVFFSFDKLAVILKKRKILWNWTSPLNLRREAWSSG